LGWTGRSDPDRRLTIISGPIGACYIALMVVYNGNKGPQNPRDRMLSLNIERAQIYKLPSGFGDALPMRSCAGRSDSDRRFT